MEDRILTKQINFSEEVNPLEGVIIQERCPLNGKITAVTMSFPPGANQLVDIAFGHESNRVCPDIGFINLDDATPTYPGIEEDVRKNERLWVEIRNTDDTYPHRITVLVVVVGKYGGSYA